MLKNKIWLGIVLSIILLAFSVDGFTAYYKYTQESGTNFYVGTADKSDALEDTNEVRQILDDLGNLLNHSKRNDLYPKDSTTGGYLGRLNYGLDASKPAIPVVNDVYLATDTVKVYRCFVAGNWVQVYPITEVDPTVDTDAEIKAILVDEVTKTGTFTAGKIAKINNATGIIEMATNTDAQVSDAVTKAHAKNADTDLDATFEATFVKKADTVNVLSDITSTGANIEDAVTKKHTSGSETLVGDVSGTVGANTVDKIKGHTVDETAIGDNKILVYKTTGDKYVYEIRDLSLYYLKTDIDTQGEVETIWGVTLSTDAERNALTYSDVGAEQADAGLTSLAGLTYASDSFIKVTANDTYAIRTLAEVKTDLAYSSDDLSDVASIAMLDEGETVTGGWTFATGFVMLRAHDAAGAAPYFYFKRARDGDPTSNVSSGDALGSSFFLGYHTDTYYKGAEIRALVDGTPDASDMPGRLEFLTTPDGGYDVPLLRMAIDSAGNIKMGDGAWTNYIKVTAAGAMTAEGTATIKATDLVIASQAAGDILYFNGTNWIRLAIGTAGQILTVNAGGTAPEWQTP